MVNRSPRAHQGRTRRLTGAEALKRVLCLHQGTPLLSSPVAFDPDAPHAGADSARSRAISVMMPSPPGSKPTIARAFCPPRKIPARSAGDRQLLTMDEAGVVCPSATPTGEIAANATRITDHSARARKGAIF